MKKNLTITTTERKKKKKRGYTNLLTITSKLFSLAYFTQKILSGYCSDDIYKKGLRKIQYVGKAVVQYVENMF